MGGYIAYELCKALTKKQLPLPNLLVLSSVPAPKHWTARKALSELSEEEFSLFFLKLGGIQPELLKHESFIKMQLALLRDDIALCESCQHNQTAQFTFPLLALGGSHDEYVSINSMTTWKAETIRDFNLHELTGNHFYLNTHLPLIFELIKKRMTINVEL
jgi:surfactin synthase thioesterase subunit